MKKEKIDVEIPKNEEIVFVGHKSAIPLSVSLGEATIYTAGVLFFCIDMYSRTGHNIFLALTILAVSPIWYGVYAALDWNSEVHIVTSYTEKEGGRYMKMSGVFGQKIHETSITRSTPDAPRENALALRLWKFFTSQDVTKMTLRSDGNTIIVSDLVPTALYRAIADMKGEPPRTRSRNSARVVDVTSSIRSGYHAGLLKREAASELLQLLLESEVQ